MSTMVDKINAGNFNFMIQINVMEAIQSIKLKNMY